MLTVVVACCDTCVLHTADANPVSKKACQGRPLKRRKNQGRPAKRRISQGRPVIRKSQGKLVKRIFQKKRKVSEDIIILV